MSGTRIEAFSAGTHPVGADLADLVALLAAGRLDPQVGWCGGWDRVHDAVGALQERRVNGEAVLEVAQPGAVAPEPDGGCVVDMRMLLNRRPRTC